MWCQAGEARALCCGVRAGLFCAALWDWIAALRMPRLLYWDCSAHVCCANGMSCRGRPRGRSGFHPSAAPPPCWGYQLGHNGTRGQSKCTGMRCAVPTEGRDGCQPAPGGCMRGKRRAWLQGACAGQGEMQAKDRGMWGQTDTVKVPGARNQVAS